jgi:hypothetical protein
MIDHLIRAGGAVVTFFLLKPDHRRVKKWDILLDETPLGIGLFFDFLRSLGGIFAAIGVAIHVRQDSNQLFDYIVSPATTSNGNFF